MDIEITFMEGPLGIGLTDTRHIIRVYPDSQADKLGVKPGDLLVAVAGQEVGSLSHLVILESIKAASRPLVLRIFRAEGAPAALEQSLAGAVIVEAGSQHAAASETKPSGSSSGGVGAILSLNAADARAGAKAAVRAAKSASSFMRGVLSQGVSAVKQGLDRASDSTAFKQLATAAKTTVRDTTRRAARLDLRQALSRPELAAALLADPAFASTRAYTAALDASLASCRSRNDAIINAIETLDVSMSRAAGQASQYHSELHTLGRVAGALLPSMAADVASLTALAESLKESMIALEGRLTKVSMARNARMAAALRAEPVRSAEAYAVGKAAALAEADGRLGAWVAERSAANALLDPSPYVRIEEEAARGGEKLISVVFNAQGTASGEVVTKQIAYSVRDMKKLFEATQSLAMGGGAASHASPGSGWSSAVAGGNGGGAAGGISRLPMVHPHQQQHGMALPPLKRPEAGAASVAASAVPPPAAAATAVAPVVVVAAVPAAGGVVAAASGATQHGSPSDAGAAPAEGAAGVPTAGAAAIQPPPASTASAAAEPAPAAPSSSSGKLKELIREKERLAKEKAAADAAAREKAAARKAKTAAVVTGGGSSSGAGASASSAAAGSASASGEATSSPAGGADAAAPVRTAETVAAVEAAFARDATVAPAAVAAEPASVPETAAAPEAVAAPSSAAAPDSTSAAPSTAREAVDTGAAPGEAPPRDDAAPSPSLQPPPSASASAGAGEDAPSDPAGASSSSSSSVAPSVGSAERERKEGKKEKSEKKEKKEKEAKESSKKEKDPSKEKKEKKDKKEKKERPDAEEATGTPVAAE